MELFNFLKHSWFFLVKLVETHQGECTILGIVITILLGVPPILSNLKPRAKKILAILSLISITFVFFVLFVKYRKSVEVTHVATTTNIDNLKNCIGFSEGEKRYTRFSECIDGFILPNTVTADQMLDILGSIPRDSMQRRDALVTLLRNSKITISGSEANLLLRAFGADLRRSALVGISCHIRRPILDSDKDALLSGIDPIWKVRQELEKFPTPPCEN